MIHEEDEAKPIDFSWFYFIGKTKLNLSFKETGRLTLRMFNKFYLYYKNTFDFESAIKMGRTSYHKLAEEQNKSEEWF